MKKRYLLSLLFILALSDIALVNTSLFVGFHITNRCLVDVDYSIYTGNIEACIFLWLVSAGIFSLYTYKSIQNFDTLYKRTIFSLVSYGLLFSGYLYYSSGNKFPIEFIAVLLPLIGMAFVLSRFTATAVSELVFNNVKSAKQEKVSTVQS
ncbi:MAG TPA: hypothetical protein VGB63_03890 [Pedobacter sp.]|jgi:hypothetical protein